MPQGYSYPQHARIAKARRLHAIELTSGLPYPAATESSKALAAKRIAAQVARQEREDNKFL